MKQTSLQPLLLVQGGVALPLDLREVARELQADADVILHAADLAAEGDGVLLERGERGLVLVRVDLHLLPEAQRHPAGVAGDEGLSQVDAVLLQHQDDELAHGVLDRVGGEDPDAVVGLVRVEPCVGQVGEGPLMVLCGGSSQS